MNKVTKYLQLLRNPKINKVDLAVSILQELNYDELCSLRNRTPIVFKSIVTANYLKRNSFESIAKSGQNFSSVEKDYIEYIGTLAYIFEQNKEQINSFAKCRDAFEYCLLNGKYKECNDLLERINKISYSLWGADISIKLQHLTNGLAGATDEYNRLYRINKRLSVLCYYAYKTSDVEAPFESDVNHFLKGFRDDQDTREYVIAHSFPYIKVEEGNWTMNSGVLSLIDLYQIFILSLRSVSERTRNDNRFKRYLNIIDEAVDDPIVHKFSWLFLGKAYRFDDEEIRNDIVDAFYKAEYPSVVNKASAFFVKHPHDTAILDIYVKSIIQSQLTINERERDGTLANKLCYYYYRYLLNDDSSSLYLRKLKNICQVWASFQSFLHLARTCEVRENNDILSDYVDYWRTSPSANFQDILLYHDHPDRLKLLELWSPAFYGKYSELITSHNVIDKSDYIDIQFDKKKDIFDELLIINGIHKVPVYSRNKVCSFIFSQFLKSEQYQEAIAFFADEMLSKEHLSLTLLDETMIDELQNSDVERNCSNPLDFSIFYTFLNYAPYKRYLSYKRYLKQRGIEKASMISVDGSEKIHYFLENVADRKVLGLHVRMFRNSQEVIEERIAIVNKLYEYYKDKKYAEEVNSLVQELTINGLVQQVDESKIYVDTDSIKNTELKDCSVLFELLKNTDENLKYFEDKSSYIIQLISLLKEKGMTSVLVFDPSENQIATNYKYSLFKKLYLAVRDQFVSNPKFGLDYYLSTRIRHGTIDNQLRNHFLEFHLVTNINESGDYAVNSYWIEKFGVYNDDYRHCVQAFSKFSHTIDDIILKLKSEKIQIKTEDETEKSGAIFDFSSDQLEWFFDDIYSACIKGTYDNCIESIFDKLWEYTHICLDKMRDELSHTHDMMRDTLNELYNNIFAIVPDNKWRKSFGDAITSCTTDLQKDFDIVNGWFQRKNTPIFDFTLQQVFDASLSAINRINQGALKLKTQIDSNSAFMGSFFGAFHDLFHDLLNNVLDYEKKGHVQSGLGEVSVFESENYLDISVSNPIAKEDIPELNRILEEQDGKYSSLLSSGQSRLEGKSGFTKIYNIINNILHSEDNSYQNKLDGELFVAKIQINTQKLLKR